MVYNTMYKHKKRSLSRVAEGIGPKTPGNLGASAFGMSEWLEAEKVLNPTGISIEFFLKDEVKTSLRNQTASLSMRGFLNV